MELLKTGIAGFDEYCNGGLPPGLIILYGAPGSGNDVFAQQVCFERAKNGKKVTYLSTMKPFYIIENDATTYGFDFSSLKKGKKWKFIDGRKSKAIINLIQSELKEGHWVTIDSLSDILLSHDLETMIQLINSISINAWKYEGLHFALLTKGMHDPRVETAMLHFADGVIDFLFTEGTHAQERKIAIKKMRGTIVSTRSLPFSISETGLVIETSVRIT